LKTKKGVEELKNAPRGKETNPDTVERERKKA